MRLVLVWLLLLLYLVDALKQKFSGKTNEDDRFRRQTCAGRGIQVNSSSPTHISAAECCDVAIESILRQAMNSPDQRYGDTARAIQKKVQRQLGHSYEVIVSRGDFSVSSYYHGMQICKVENQGIFMLAYETPINYNIDDIPEESRMAAIDAQEILGSTPEDDRGHFLDFRVDPLAGEDPAIQSPPKTARAATINSKFGNNTDLRQGTDLSEGESRLPETTTCSRDMRDGNKCCSGNLFEVMKSALDELSTSPDFDDHKKTPGIVANLIKRHVQQRFGRVFEVIVSRSDFQHVTHHLTDFTCKFNSHDLFVLAFETPNQSIYHPFNLAEEAHFSSISNREPLGTSDWELPGQRDISKNLELEAEGERTGYPKGSHCTPGERRGSSCCNLALFQAMYSAVKRLQADDLFNQYDRRFLATEIRNAAEGATGRPMEVVLANDDFVVSSHETGDNHCKFRVEHYFIMAWETPGEYGLGEDYYADNGLTSMVGCGELDVEGAYCCSGELRYTITKAVDDSTNRVYDKMNTENVARAVVRAAQTRFNTQMNTVVSRGDFIWLHADGSIAETSSLVCKIDLFDFHVLTFDAGTGIPTQNEFTIGDVVDVPPALAQQPPVLQQIAPPQTFQQVPAIQTFQQVPAIQTFQQVPAIQAFQQGPVLQAFQQVPSPQFFQQVPAQVPQFIDAPPIQSPLVEVPVYNYYVPATASFCFSEDTWVTTPNGKKNMAQLEIGDYVLTANQTHAYYAPVTVWMHRNPEKVAHFFTIMTEYGKMLRMTAKHFIYRNKCDEYYKEFVKTLPATGEEIFASELKGQWKQQRIKEITRTKRKGIYAPLTSNGRIIVNDILASCYSDVKGQTIQSTYFEAISLMRQAYYGVAEWLAEKKIELPFSTDLWRDVLSLILPN